MESKQQTPSVILKLMGLDKVPPQHKDHVSDRRKVLSKDYLQKVASIGVRKKRLSHQPHSLEKEESDDVLKVVKTMRRDKNHNPSKVVGAPQELFDDASVKWKPETFTSSFNCETCVKANPGKGGVGFKYSSLCSSCKDSCLVKEIFCPKSIRLYSEMRDTKKIPHQVNFRRNETFAEGSDMLRPASNVSIFACSDGSYVGSEGKCKTLDKRDVAEKLQVGQHGDDSTHQQFPVISKHENGASNLSRQSGFRNGKFIRSISCKVGVNYSYARRVPMARPLCAASVIANNCAIMTKDDLFRKYWGLRKNASSNWSTQKSKKQNINEKDYLEDMKPRSNTEKFPSFSSYLKKRCYGMDLSDKKPVLFQLSSSGPSPAIIDCQILKQTCLMNGDAKINEHEDSNMSKQSAMVPDLSVDCLVSDAKTEVASWLHNNLTKQQSESKASVMTHGDNDSLIHTSYASTVQGIPEQEDSTYSLCSVADPDSLGSFQEAYEPSPVSVLDPTECGAVLYDSSDDEGLDLNVSSDEECENESIGNFGENKNIQGISTTEESRDFSYVVEVLTEAGISNKNVFKDFSTWHSEECPISPFVFEILEKKFGEQQDWKRSERRLLFDRINLGLLEVLEPHLYVPKWEKPVSRRVNVEPSQDMIEEEMWGLLVSQEKKASKQSADAMLGGEVRWIELGEDVEDILKETVKLLIEELVEEIVRLEDFLKL